jgi:hypothetical protein
MQSSSMTLCSSANTDQRVGPLSAVVVVDRLQTAAAMLLFLTRRSTRENIDAGPAAAGAAAQPKSALSYAEMQANMPRCEEAAAYAGCTSTSSYVQIMLQLQ